MKTIDIDDDLYQFIASQTQFIGESASDILRRLLLPEAGESPANPNADQNEQPQTSVQQAPVASESQAGSLDSLISVEALKAYDTVVEKFLFALSALAKANADAFASVLEIKGSDRLYFATSKDSLLASGSSTNPKSIPDSHYWVVTNNNSIKKMNILKQVMQGLGYAEAEIMQTIERILPNK